MLSLADVFRAIRRDGSTRGSEHKPGPLRRAARGRGYGGPGFTRRRPKAARLTPVDPDGRASWVREGRARRRAENLAWQRIAEQARAASVAS